MTLIHLPGSKSLTNRALVLAALSRGVTELRGALFAEDTLVALQCLKDLGFWVESYPSERLMVVDATPLAKYHLMQAESKNFSNYMIDRPLFFGQAGTMARFFPAVLLNWQATFPNAPQIQVKCIAHPQLSRRPLAPLCHALRNWGANIQGDHLPFILRSGVLTGATTISGEISGQFLSGLLFAGAGSRRFCLVRREGSTLVQPGYVRMTLDLLRTWGSPIFYDEDLSYFEIHSPPTAGDGSYTWNIESDLSTLGPLVAAALVAQKRLIIEHLPLVSLQPDRHFINFLQYMGAHVSWPVGQTVLEVHPAPPAFSDGQTSLLKGGFTWDFSAMSDQALTAGVLACFADAAIMLTGIAHIRHHESNRIAALVENLTRLGVEAQEHEDGFTVHPLKSGQTLQGVWQTHNDHRMAMAGAVLQQNFPGVTLDDPACVAKTCPEFFELLNST